MKIRMPALALLLLAAPHSHGEEAAAILARVDRNLSARTRIAESSMTIHSRRGSRTLTARSYAEGTRKSFTEYLAPTAEKGTKMLKLARQLWLYSPATDRTIQISGHLLRQPVMGSDLSYEDLMDDRKLAEIYEGRIAGEEEIAGRRAWVLELVARVADAAYPRQKIWVDRERDVPLRQELYAKSGKLLKEVTYAEATRVEGRWYPRQVRYRDVLKQGQGTELTVSKITFDQPIPEWIFSKAALKQ
ncbi:MAG TPA: outer membrane lipoprotein-sorting protein [bacterium]|nr:outer membrane lipoprotein-sorting protein [bacterium]HPR87043.1 outer membrane lipoprotein-sorting protein [bacterium]